MKIAFTGGGTAGHAMANTILIPFLQKKQCRVIYIGSHNGMEKELVQPFESVKYYGIGTGKWRRYLSMDNFTDIFRVMKGCLEAYRILKAEKPHVLYSGGGYVSVPVVLAAKSLRIPILIRETDYSVGLANRLCLPFAQRVFTAFPDTLASLPENTGTYPGILVRPELYDMPKFPAVYTETGKPLCLILGGSTGAKAINEAVWDNLDELTSRYDIIHICGKGKLQPEIVSNGFYKQYEFVRERLGDFLNAADVVVTRCGSNAILETLALGKKTVCIPITSKSSRGEQEQNATFAVSHGNAVLLKEQLLDGSSLCDAIAKALRLNNKMPFQITRKLLLSNIEAHIEEIYRVGLKKMEQRFWKNAKGRGTVNFMELANDELAMYDEIVSAYGNEW